MVQHINDRRASNIITIEDPIEFVHRDVKSHINQREVGTDTATFAQALRRVLRQDPDVIMIGEIRDLETLDVALKAASTGSLGVLDAAHDGRDTDHQPHPVVLSAAPAERGAFSPSRTRCRRWCHCASSRPTKQASALVRSAREHEACATRSGTLSATLNIPDLIKEGSFCVMACQTFAESLMNWLRAA
jgi:twitching motility protein PilT